MRAVVFAGALALLAPLFVVPTAQAAIVTVTYAGSVTTSAGNLGAFGTADANLAGMDYVAVYRFDTNLGAFADTPEFENLVGGTSTPLAAPSPLLSATLTINGVTVALRGDNTSILGTRRNNFFAGVQTIARWVDNPDFGDRQSLEHSVSWATPLFDISKSLEQSFSYTFGPDDSVSGSFLMQDVAVTGCCDSRGASGGLTARTITYATAPAPAAVPEPGTWALVISGFGLAGASLRRRRIVQAS